jgi:ribA/ribD-fused uncharacterized protein
MSCIRLTKTNGENSLLFDKLYEITKDENEANELYSYFMSPEFILIFGNYESHYKTDMPNLSNEDKAFNARLDINGEPALFFDEVLNKYYFRDRYDEPVFYPYGKTGLSKNMLINNIKAFSRSMALTYYKNNFKFDFDNLDFNKTTTILLKDFVTTHLNEKASSLSNSNDIDEMLQGKTLSKTLDNVDEWVTEVKDFYNTIKTELTSNDDIVSNDDVTKNDLMRTESFLKSNKDSVNNNIKLYISLLQNDVKNEYGEFDFIPFDDIYSTLNKTLANKTYNVEKGEDIYEVYMDQILKISQVKPYFNLVYDELSEIKSENFKNQFSSAFNLYKKNYLTSEISKDRKTYVVKNLSEVGSRKNNIISQWLYNFTEATNKKVGNISKLEQAINTSFQKFNGNYNKIDNVLELIQYKNDLKKSLNSLGVVVTKEGFDFYLNDLEFENKSVDGIKSSIRKTYTSILHSLKNQKDNLNGNIMTNQTSYKKMAEAEAFFQKEGTDASILTMGKTKWAYSKPSHLDLKIAQWQKDPQLLIDHYDSTLYNQGSHWMAFLSASHLEDVNERIEKSRERLNVVEANVFNSVQEEGNSIDGVDLKGISKTDSLVDYMNKVLAFKKGAKSYHKTALAADKSTEYQLYLGEDSDYINLSTSVDLFEDKIVITDPVTLDIFYKYYKSEYERIGYVYDEIETKDPSELLPNYHLGQANGLKSQLFPSLSDNELMKLFDENGKPLYANLDQVKDEVISHISSGLSEGIRRTYDRLIDNEVFSVTSLGERINNSLDEKVYNSYTSSFKNKAFYHVAADMFVNSVVSQVEYSKMFSGDVAYYKNIADYKKRVPATYSDGMYMRLTDPSEKYFNASIIAAVEVGYEDLESLPESVREYYQDKINTTDGQAWITPERWKFIMIKLGKWNNTVQSAYDKMTSTKPASFTKKELKVLAQPLKGVYFDVIKGRPVYLKYSQAVLLPNLIKGMPLEKLYNKMTQDENGKTLDYTEQIHELITKDGIKVGYPIPEVTHDDNGNVAEDFKLNKIQLDNGSWKLQQDLPVKGLKATELGSQIQKNVFQGLTHTTNSNFDLDEKEYTNNEMIDMLHQVTKALSNIGLEEVKKSLGIDDEFTIKNEDKLYSSIIKQLKQRSGTSNNLIKALEAKTSPYGIPGGLNVFQNIFSSIINKHAVKIKTNGAAFIQMADYGLSKSEAENKGIKFTPWFESNKLKMPESYINEDGKTKYKPGGIFISGSILAKYIPNYNEIDTNVLFGNKENNYNDGIIDKEILENIIGYRIPNQGLASNDALTIMGVLPPGMGDTVIAYTGITTKTGSDFDIDKMFLMIPSFKAKYPKTDLDKGLKYIIDNNLTNTELTEELVEYGWSKSVDGLPSNLLQELFIEEILLNDSNDSNFYTDFNDTYEIEGALSLTYAKYDTSIPYDKQPKQALQNRLIELYKSILLNPDVIEDVLNPVDADFMAKDIKNSSPEPVRGDLMHFDAISDIDTKSEFMLGKAGLGQNVNSLVDAVRGALSENEGLGFNDYYLGWGKVNGNGDTGFDHQYSEELTDTDIKEYLKYSNDVADTSFTKEELTNPKKLRRIKLDTSMMALVNGFVDIANDSYIVRGNWVTQTNNIGFMLLRAGVHPFKVNAFLAQPILKDYIEFVNNKESKSIQDTSSLDVAFKIKKSFDLVKDTYLNNKVNINGLSYEYSNIFRSIIDKDALQSLKYTEGTTKDTKYNNPKYNTAKEKLINDIKKKLMSKFNITKEDLKGDQLLIDQFSELFENDILPIFNKSFEIVTLPFTKITLGKMKEELSNSTSTDPQFQFTILEKFEEWQTQAKKLAANVSASKVDVDGKGKDIISAIIAANKIRYILEQEGKQTNFTGFRNKLSKNEIDTILNTYLKNSVGFSQKVMENNPKFFLVAQPNAVKSFNFISRHVYDKPLVDEKLGGKLQNDFYSYVMSGFNPLKFSYKELNDILVKLPGEFSKLKTELNNPLLNELTIKPSDIDELFVISMSNVKKSTSYKNTLTDSWNELLETHPDFANKLITYSYLISGFNNSFNQFHEFIPYEWFNKHRFNSYLKNINLEDDIPDMNFVDNFFRHRLEDNTLSTQFKFKQLIKTKYGNDMNSAIMLDPKRIKENATPPYIIRVPIEDIDSGKLLRTQYYKFVGTSISSHFMYVRTTPLGLRDNKGNKFVEFDNSHDYSIDKPSISKFKTNKPNNVDNNVISKIQLDYGHNTSLPTSNNDLDHYINTVNKKGTLLQQSSEIKESNVTSLTQEVRNVAEGVKIIDNALSLSEETEIFDMLKPFLEEQGSKSNKGKSAPIMIGLNLRWDYKSNNPGKTAISIKETINNSTYQKNKYGYYDVSIDGNALGPIPDRLKELMTKATGIDASNYDGAIINLYKKNSFISAHNDVDESITAIGYPVLVVNIGGEGSLSIEGSESQRAKKGYTSKEYTNEPLESGSAYIFGNDGKNRDVFHRTIPSKGTGTLPSLTVKGETIPANSYRISVTLRRVEDLESGMPLTPNKIENSTQQTSEVKEELTSDTKINIYAGTNENAELSNFANRPFKATYSTLIGDENYEFSGDFKSVEQAFQYAKSMFLNKFKDTDSNNNILEKIKNTTSPSKAKSLGRTLTTLNSKEWDNESQYIMKDLINQSFKQNPYALQKLLDTGNATLTHTQDKGKWGKLFPKVLMEVRNELKDTVVKEVESNAKTVDELFNKYKEDFEREGITAKHIEDMLVGKSLRELEDYIIKCIKQ